MSQRRINLELCGGPLDGTVRDFDVRKGEAPETVWVSGITTLGQPIDCVYWITARTSSSGRTICEFQSSSHPRMTGFKITCDAHGCDESISHELHDFSCLNANDLPLVETCRKNGWTIDLGKKNGQLITFYCPSHQHLAQRPRHR